MVVLTARLADTAAGKALDHEVIVNVKIDRAVYVHNFRQGFGLGNGAGEAVQNETLFRVAFRKTFFYKLNSISSLTSWPASMIA